MFYKTRFLLSSLLLCSALVACGDNDNEAVQTSNTESVTTETESTQATEQQVATDTALSGQSIETGMSEQAVTDLLGKPTLTQTHTLDTLSLTHSEWTDESGTASVQFQNGEVTFSQFTPVDK